MTKCVFCEIVKGNLESAKIWEDSEFLAILDIMPNTKGMTIVLTKKHYPSYAFDLDEELYSKLMLASKKVAKILEKGLKVKRVAMVMEGMGINHIHIKLYPLYGIKKKFEEKREKEKIWFDKYEGYISTQPGDLADIAALKKIATQIKKRAGL